MDKYEEALERAKEWEREHPNGYVIRDMMEHIFPGYNDSEDEMIRQTLIDMVKRETGFTGFPSQGQVLAYLEKQKEQKPYEPKNWPIDKDNLTQEQKPAEWNEVDTLTLDSIISIVEDWESEQSAAEKEYYGATQKSDFLKALPERFNLQPKQEWSEEDGLARDFLLKQIEQYIKVLESIKTEKYIGAKGLIDVASELSGWQSARSFILSLRPHWKPSEEQMGALENARYMMSQSGDYYDTTQILYSLINDLKKL